MLPTVKGAISPIDKRDGKDLLVSAGIGAMNGLGAANLKASRI